MRAVLCERWGGPEDLRFGETPDPEPGPGEVAIAVRAAGLNFADTLMISGKYQEKPAFPFSPGLEAAGTVAAVGPGVAGLAVGERVLAMMGRGAFAERAVTAADSVMAIPDEMDFATAAGFPIVYGTAHGGFAWKARLAPGELVLVTGAAGGVGLAAVEVAKAMGAVVIAAASSADKLAVAKAHGADFTVDYAADDLRERLKAIAEQANGGRGVDVCFDPVGGEVFTASFRAMAFGGRMLVVGFASGAVPEIKANHLLVKNIDVQGLYWGGYRRHRPDLVREQFPLLFRWFREGRLKPEVGQRFPLAEAGRAMAEMLARRARGKIVLTVAR